MNFIQFKELLEVPEVVVIDSSQLDVSYSDDDLSALLADEDKVEDVPDEVEEDSENQSKEIEPGIGEPVDKVEVSPTQTNVSLPEPITEPTIVTQGVQEEPVVSNEVSEVESETLSQQEESND